jgi:hypothetical protein
MARPRGKKTWMLWLGSLIAVSGISAYIANPEAAKTKMRAARTRARAVTAAYKVAVRRAPKPRPAPSAAAPEAPVEPDLRDSVAALAVGAPAGRLPAAAIPGKFPAPKRTAARKRVKPRRKIRPVRRRLSPTNEEDFLKLFQVSAPTRLSKDKTFLVEGEIFDIQSGKLLRETALYFTDPKSRKAFRATTDARGEYAIRLPRNIDGYRLAIFKTGYRYQYLRDWSPSMRDSSAAIRRQVAAELLALRFEGLMVFHRPREDQLIDFALISR